MPLRPPTSLVLGATGFLGRWLLLELLSQGVSAAAAVRGEERDRDLRRWLQEHGADTSTLYTVHADLTRADLGLSAADDGLLGSVRDVHNTAAVFRFGLSREQARAANVDGALHAVQWASTRTHLRRLVHISGYRVGRAERVAYPLPADRLDRLYRRLGAYEASKAEADLAVRATAPDLRVPLTVVNPSSVIGHSVTGEAGQYLGLAATVHQLWTGRLPALAGGRRTFVPVVAVDYLARFLAAVPEIDRGQVERHTVLDAATPELPALIGQIATALGVRAPRLTVPVGLVRRLPRALTGIEPETLSFLSEDRYDTASADRLAAAAGLSHPPVRDLLSRWAVRLVEDGFASGNPEAAR